MKTILTLLAVAFLFLLGNFNVNAQAVHKVGLIIKTVASTGTPEAITSTNLFCTSVTLKGKKAARTDNTGTVYIGWSSTNDEQAFDITAGGEIVIKAAQGRQLNLAQIYIDVTNNGDGVAAFYE